MEIPVQRALENRSLESSNEIDRILRGQMMSEASQVIFNPKNCGREPRDTVDRRDER